MKKAGLFLFLLLVLTFCSKKEEKSKKNILELTSQDYSVTFEYKDFEKHYGSCVNDSDCAEVKIHYPQLLGKTEVTTKINNGIISILLNEEDEEMRYSSFDEIADSLITEYKSVQKDFEDYHIAWFIHKNLELTGIVKNYLSIKHEETMYTGGANAYYNVNLKNFDLNTGEEVLLNQLIGDGNMNKLLKLGESEFRKLKDIPSNVNLDKSGYWFTDDQFYLPENFSLTDSGFVFFYNLYEIAPRSEGPTELFLSKEKVRDILKNKDLFD